MQIRYLLSIFFFSLALNISAQSYQLTISNETYFDLVGSTSLNGNMTWDDPEFNIPIGFSFQFFDQTYTELAILEIGVGGSLGIANNTTDFSPLLLPYGADIIDRGYDFNADEPTPGSLSNISYLLEGTAGNRILKVEWNNVGFYTEIEQDNISSDFTNFQMWLYEGTNNIEIRFGNNSITNLEASFDEQTGSIIGLIEEINLDTEEFTGEALVLRGPPETAELIEVFGDTDQILFLEGVIPSGTVYSFSESIGVSTSESLDDLLKITTFPNPVTTHLEISMEDPNYQITTVSIHNLAGQLLKEVVYDQQPIDISFLNAGIYLLEIKTTAGIVNRKMVKK